MESAEAILPGVFRRLVAFILGFKCWIGGRICSVINLTVQAERFPNPPELNLTHRKRLEMEMGSPFKWKNLESVWVDMSIKSTISYFFTAWIWTA